MSIVRDLLASSAKEIFETIIDSNTPSETATSYPIQSVYLAVQATGLDGSTELLSVLSKEQYRYLLDFELWHSDRLVEENFWSWFSTVDQDESLEPLEKFVQALDPTVLSWLVVKHVLAEFYEEVTDASPGPGWFTPDKGFTWMCFPDLEDPEKLRLMGRIMAYLFENDSDYFYKLISLPKVGTCSEYEENAFQKRQKRLASEGFVDTETAWALFRSRPLQSLASKLAENDQPTETSAYSRGLIVSPYFSDLVGIEPLASALRELNKADDQAALRSLAFEFTRLANAALTRFDVTPSEFDAVRFLVKKLRGAANISLDFLSTRDETKSTSLGTMIRTLGLAHLVQGAISELLKLQQQARILRPLVPDDNQALGLLLEMLMEKFPAVPGFARSDAIPNGPVKSLDVTASALERWEDVLLIREHLEFQLKALTN